MRTLARNILFALSAGSASPAVGADAEPDRAPTLARLSVTETVVGLPVWEPTTESREVAEVRHLARVHFADTDEGEALVRLATDRYEDREAVLEWLAVRPGDRVLDLGCGIGWFTISIAQQVGPGGTVHALEIRESLLRMLHLRMKRQPGLTRTIRARMSTADSTGLPDSTVDVALFAHLGFLLRDPLDPEAQRLLADVHRVVRPGGRLVAVQWIEGPEGKDILPYVLHLEQAGFELWDWAYDEVNAAWMLEFTRL